MNATLDQCGKSAFVMYLMRYEQASVTASKRLELRFERDLASSTL